MIELLRATEELQENFKVIKQTLERIIAVGEVVEVNPQTHRVRVKLKGRQGIITDFLPVLVPMSYKDKVYTLPKVGDTVLCLFLPYGIEDGFVLGSFYTLNDKKPANDENIHMIEFEDGTRVEYDKTAHKLSVNIPQGEAYITVLNGSGNVYINGNLIVSGQIYDLGKVKGSLDDFRKVFNSHTHTGDSGGTTSVPNQQI